MLSILNENKKAIICDLCGGSPKCVEWCPKEVISLKVIEKAVKMSSYLGKMLFVDLTNKIIEERALLKKMG